MGLTPYSLSGLLTVTTALALSVIIIRDARTTLHKIWLFFNISVALWGLGVLFLGSATTQSDALIWWRIAYAGVIFIPVFFFHTVWLFCNLKNKKLLYFAYIQGLFFLIALQTNYMFTGVELKFNSFYYFNPGILHHMYLAVWIFIVIYGHYHLIQGFRKFKGIKKAQSKYFFFGMFTGFVGGITNFAPVYDINIYPYGNFLIPLYSLILTYAIFRYRLLDINIVIARFTIFSILFLTGIGISLLIFINKINKLISLLGQSWFLILVIISSYVIATLLNFIYLFIQNKAENKLLMNQRRQHQALLSLSRNMTLIKDLNQLSDLIVNSIVDSAEIDYCSVFLSDDQNYFKLVKQKPVIVSIEMSLINSSPLIKKLTSSKAILVREELDIKGDSLDLIPIMEHLNCSVISPAFIKDNLLGFIVIGNKLSGQPYSEDDLGIFSTISNHAALAIENALFFRELEQAQTELFQAAKMSSLGTLASGMGHQINNRLQAISSLVEFVKIFHSNQLDKNASDCLNKALENVEQGKNIIQSLREHARPTAEGYQPISLQDAFNNAIEMVKLKKGSRFDAVTVKVINNKNSFFVLGNKSQLQEVFFNLIDNADDAIHEAFNELHKNNRSYHPSISIKIQQSKDENYLDIIVKDNGIGMNKEQMDKLFVPFHTTKATSQKGTGLGLYVIDRIIKGHGGKISVTSQLGQGTNFVIQLKKAKNEIS